jgi:hypothetical protein
VAAEGKFGGTVMITGVDEEDIVGVIEVTEAIVVNIEVEDEVASVAASIVIVVVVTEAVSEEDVEADTVVVTEVGDMEVLAIAVDLAMDKEVLLVDLLGISLMAHLLVHRPVAFPVVVVVDTKAVTAAELTTFQSEEVLQGVFLRNKNIQTNVPATRMARIDGNMTTEAVVNIIVTGNMMDEIGAIEMGNDEVVTAGTMTKEVAVATTMTETEGTGVIAVLNEGSINSCKASRNMGVDFICNLKVQVSSFIVCRQQRYC